MKKTPPAWNFEARMPGDPKPNEWNLLRDKFRALVCEGSESIEDIFDAQFRCHFSELINRVAEGGNQTDSDARSRF